jgi:hypothetical protein
MTSLRSSIHLFIPSSIFLGTGNHVQPDLVLALTKATLNSFHGSPRISLLPFDYSYHLQR